MYDKVFDQAAELGREEELFDLTKEEKAMADAAKKYHQTVNEAELLGPEAERSPADFFVSS